MPVLHQTSGGIEKSIPSALEISLGLRPWEISRVSGNLSFPIPPEVWWSTGILSSSICLQGVDQKILSGDDDDDDERMIHPTHPDHHRQS